MERDVRVGPLRSARRALRRRAAPRYCESLRANALPRRRVVAHRTADRRTPARATSPGCSTRSVDAFEATGDDEWLDIAASALARICSSTTGTVTCRRRTRRTSAAASSRAATSSPTCTRSPRRSSTARRRRVTPSRCRALARFALCTGDLDDARASPSDSSNSRRRCSPRTPSAVPDLLEAAGFALAGVEVVIPGDANELSDYMDTHFTRRAVLVTGNGSVRAAGGSRDRRRPTSVARASVSCPSTSVTDLATQLRNVGA